MTTFSSCIQTSIESKVEKALSDLTNKFPQLPKGKDKQTDFYVHIRTVERNKFQIQLWSTPTNIRDKQEIVIFINPDGAYYAIPFFSNTYRDYWNFKFDQPIPNIKRVNTTFDKELHKAYDSLNFNDTLWTKTNGTVINELLFSVLRCKYIDENDGIIFKDLLMTANNDLPEENCDSCAMRFKQNYIEILSKIKLNRIGNSNNAYLDEDNKRIYLFHEIWKQKKVQFSIKVYRQDCTEHSLSM
jgi:hypothetical protein